MLILSCSRSNRALKFIINLITRECCITDRSENLQQGSTYWYPVGTLQVGDSSPLLFWFLIFYWPIQARG